MVFMLGMAIAFAAYPWTTQPNTYNYHGSRLGGVKGATPGAVPTYATAKVSDAGKASTYLGKGFPTSFGSLGKLGKKALGRLGPMVGAGLIVNGVLEGAGWAINELGNQVTEPGEQPPLTGGVWCMNASGWGQQFSAVRCSSTARGAAFPSSPDGLASFLEIERTNGGVAIARYVKQKDGDTYLMPVMFKPGGAPAGAVNGNAVSDRVVSDAELGEAIANAGPEAVNQVLNQGGVIQMTPELATALNELTEALEAEKGPADGSEYASDLDNDEATEPAPTEREYPEFCAWANIVCDWIGWTQEEPVDQANEPIAVQELGDKPEWSSGLPSNGACPVWEGFTVTFMGKSTTLNVDATPLCTALQALRPLVIVASLITAAFIIGGRKSV